MNNQIVRFLVLLIAFAIGISASSIINLLGSHHSTSIVVQNDELPTRDRSQEILNTLIPNGTWADATKLESFERAEVIRVLQEAKRDARGDRARTVTFLLAALKEDYPANKSKLLDELTECRRLSYPSAGECADLVSDYLMELARRGDGSLLKPLFDISDLADGGFAESLGDFYSEMLEEQAEQFLLALKPYSRQTQWEFCHRAAIADGSGMDEERFHNVNELLKGIAAQRPEPLASLAKNCQAGIKRGKLEVSQ